MSVLSLPIKTLNLDVPLIARADEVIEYPTWTRGSIWAAPRRAEAALKIATRATDPLQDLLYFVRDPWPWGQPHEAAGVHHSPRRHSGGVAARGARAAASKAADRRIFGREHTCSPERTARRFRATAARTWLDRGPLSGLSETFARLSAFGAKRT